MPSRKLILREGIFIDECAGVISDKFVLSERKGYEGLLLAIVRRGAGAGCQLLHF